MTIYSLDVLLFLFGTSLVFHVQFQLLLPDLHIGFSRGRRVVSYSHLLKNFPQFLVIHTVKGFGILSYSCVNQKWLIIHTFLYLVSITEILLTFYFSFLVLRMKLLWALWHYFILWFLCKDYKCFKSYYKKNEHFLSIMFFLSWRYSFLSESCEEVSIIGQIAQYVGKAKTM